MSSPVADLVERFDVEWDLGLDFDGFGRALGDLGVEIDRPGGGVTRLGDTDRLAVARCVLDRCDRLYDLATANAWEPLVLALASSPRAAGERGARAWDALGRISYRRGEYVSAAERLGTGLRLAEDAGLAWLRPDIRSNWLRADDERLLLTNPRRMGERLQRYEDALAEALAGTVDPAAARPSDGARAVTRARGVSNLHHNLAVILRATGELDRALACHARAKAINVALGDRYRLASTLLNEALVHEARFRESRDQADLARAVELLTQLRDGRSWRRGVCFALQNLARISHRYLGERRAAGELYAEAWRIYVAIAGATAADAAFEEWTLLGWVEVAPERELPDLFRRAFDTFQAMRGNLRHVLFKRGYAERVVDVLESGLPHILDPAQAASYLGSWSAQEITDVTTLVESIDEQFAGADFSEHDRQVSDALRQMRPGPAGPDPAAPEVLMPSLHARRREYLRRIEEARLHVPRGESWDVGALCAVLPHDAAAIAYFWPRRGVPSAYVVTPTGVVVTPLPPSDFDFDTVRAPSNELRERIHRHLVAPWLDRVLAAGVRSLYLVPYDSLFWIPIHCAQHDRGSPILLHHTGLDRALYAVSLQELAASLGARDPARFGPYGDTVRVEAGLAVLDPAGDLQAHGGSAFERLLGTVGRLRAEGRLTSLAGPAATCWNVLEALRTAGWWFHLGHGSVALSADERRAIRPRARELPVEARIGAMLELADGILEDLDILLRCPTRSLQFCLLSACVSAGMDVSPGNEIAGFLRALKVRRCGPAMLAFWEISRDAGAVVMERMLQVLHEASGPVDLSAALRRAIPAADVTGLSLGRERPNSGMFGIYV